MTYINDNNGNIILSTRLTKAGKDKLANHLPLNISYFGLTDDSIDYALYDTGSVLGTDFFDLSIVSLPNIDNTEKISFNLFPGDKSVTPSIIPSTNNDSVTPSVSAIEMINSSVPVIFSMTGKCIVAYNTDIPYIRDSSNNLVYNSYCNNEISSRDIRLLIPNLSTVTYSLNLTSGGLKPSEYFFEIKTNRGMWLDYMDEENNPLYINTTDVNIDADMQADIKSLYESKRNEITAKNTSLIYQTIFAKSSFYIKTPKRIGKNGYIDISIKLYSRYANVNNINFRVFNDIGYV